MRYNPSLVLEGPLLEEEYLRSCSTEGFTDDSLEENEEGKGREEMGNKEEEASGEQEETIEEEEGVWDEGEEVNLDDLAALNVKTTCSNVESDKFEGQTDQEQLTYSDTASNPESQCDLDQLTCLSDSVLNDCQEKVLENSVEEEDELHKPNNIVQTTPVLHSHNPFLSDLAVENTEAEDYLESVRQYARLVNQNNPFLSDPEEGSGPENSTTFLIDFLDNDQPKYVHHYSLHNPFNRDISNSNPFISQPEDPKMTNCPADGHANTPSLDEQVGEKVNEKLSCSEPVTDRSEFILPADHPYKLHLQCGKNFTVDVQRVSSPNTANGSKNNFPNTKVDGSNFQIDINKCSTLVKSSGHADPYNSVERGEKFTTRPKIVQLIVVPLRGPRGPGGLPQGGALVGRGPWLVGEECHFVVYIKGGQEQQHQLSGSSSPSTSDTPLQGLNIPVTDPGDPHIEHPWNGHNEKFAGNTHLRVYELDPVHHNEDSLKVKGISEESIPISTCTGASKSDPDCHIEKGMDRKSEENHPVRADQMSFLLDAAGENGNSLEVHIEETPTISTYPGPYGHMIEQSRPEAVDGGTVEAPSVPKRASSLSWDKERLTMLQMDKVNTGVKGSLNSGQTGSQRALCAIQGVIMPDIHVHIEGNDDVDIRMVSDEPDPDAMYDHWPQDSHDDPQNVDYPVNKADMYHILNQRDMGHVADQVDVCHPENQADMHQLSVEVGRCHLISQADYRHSLPHDVGMLHPPLPPSQAHMPGYAEQAESSHHAFQKTVNQGDMQYPAHEGGMYHPASQIGMCYSIDKAGQDYLSNQGGYVHHTPSPSNQEGDVYHPPYPGNHKGHMYPTQEDMCHIHNAYPHSLSNQHPAYPQGYDPYDDPLLEDDISISLPDIMSDEEFAEPQNPEDLDELVNEVYSDEVFVYRNGSELLIYDPLEQLGPQTWTDSERLSSLSFEEEEARIAREEQEEVEWRMRNSSTSSDEQFFVIPSAQELMGVAPPLENVPIHNNTWHPEAGSKAVPLGYELHTGYLTTENYEESLMSQRVEEEMYDEVPMGMRTKCTPEGAAVPEGKHMIVTVPVLRTRVEMDWLDHRWLLVSDACWEEVKFGEQDA